MVKMHYVVNESQKKCLQVGTEEDAYQFILDNINKNTLHKAKKK